MPGDKIPLSFGVCGPSNSGKSTLLGRMVYELGGLPDRELEKLKAVAKEMGDENLAFAFYMDREEERAKKTTLNFKHKELITERYRYAAIDTPGHSDFLKKTIMGCSQADTLLLVVDQEVDEADVVQRGLMMTLLGVNQVCVCVNKMDACGYSQGKFTETAEKVKAALIKGGMRKAVVEKNIPVIPTSTLHGANLFKTSGSMSWWGGATVTKTNGATVRVDTVCDVLDRLFDPPNRKVDVPMRFPVSLVEQIKGVGDVVHGKVETGSLRPGSEVVFMPSQATGRVFSMEMHHQSHEEGLAGDIITANVRDLDPKNLPRAGDVMTKKDSSTLAHAREFQAQVQTFNVEEIQVGSEVSCVVGMASAGCRISGIKWSLDLATKTRTVSPNSLKAKQAALCVFQPLEPLPVDTFKNSDYLSRIGFTNGKDITMIGKIVHCQTQGQDEILAAFAKFDKDGNGAISPEELADVLKGLDPSWSEASLKEFMGKADKNADGKLQISEFVAWLFGAGSEIELLEA